MSAYVTDRPCPIEKPGKIAAVENETEGVPYFIKYSDLDINGHLNSIKYMEHLLDLFDLDLFKTKDIKRFEIAYQSEGKYGMNMIWRSVMKAKRFAVLLLCGIEQTWYGRMVCELS